MKKTLITLLTACAFISSNFAYPQTPPTDTTAPTEAPGQQSMEQQPADVQEEAPYEVGEDNYNEARRAAKRRQWGSIALALGAIAVAVTALVLVSTNSGHHRHGNHHRDDKDRDHHR